MKKIVFFIIISMMMIGCQRHQSFKFTTSVYTNDLVKVDVEYTVNVPYKKAWYPKDPILQQIFKLDSTMGYVARVGDKWVRYEESPYQLKSAIEATVMSYCHGVNANDIDLKELERQICSPYLESLNYTPGMEYLEAMRVLDSAMRELAKAEARLEEAKAAYVMNSFCEEMRQKINEAVADTNLE